MKRGDYYFANSVLGGVGRMYFLKIPQAAGPGTHGGKLLGSLVREGDRFLAKSYPVPENSYILGKMLDIMQHYGIAREDMVNITPLADTTQQLKIDTSVESSLKAPFPGVPASLGVELDYGKIVDVTLKLGDGSRKLHIPRDLLKDVYERMAGDSPDYHPAWFDDDRMLVDQVLLVSNLELTVSSEKEFSVDFDARAQAINDLGGGVRYHRLSGRSYQVKLTSDAEYLFALSAVEADKFLH